MSLAFELTPHPSPVDTETRARILSDAGFGKHFTDHMITIRWTAEAGWHDAQLMPRGPFQIDPAASVLHYAQEIFEGMKAYRGTDGRIRMFRPQENARRFNQSAMRMAMPEIPEDIFLDAVGRLVTADEDWIPAGSGSLYLRPFMFADDAFLGVRPASSYIFCIIACPAGAYFKGGDGAIRLWVTPDYIRAAPGGTGAAKCGGNYAGSLVAQRQAIAQDCDQVLFLDAIEGRWVEELGGMNIFFVFDDRSIITPPLFLASPAGDTESDILDKMIDTNVKGTWNGVQAVVPHMKATGGGKILNFSSVAGLTAFKGFAIYSASKAAIAMMTKVLGAELAPFNINVNAIAPGNTETPMNETMRNDPSQAAILDAMKAMTPSNRIFSKPEEIAAAALFLVSPEARPMHGSILLADEGISAAIG